MKSDCVQINENCVVQPRSRILKERCVVMPRNQNSDEPLTCAVCSQPANRVKAKFCAVCGHELREDYAPLDMLRASYNLRRNPSLKQNVSSSKQMETSNLFNSNHNSASSTATAFVVYSLVPYLGILFCPGALVLGCVGLMVSYHKPQLGGRQTAIYNLLLGSFVLAVQVLLWWLLYIVPELKR